MSYATVNGIQIAYEEDGSTDAPAVLLIHGLGMPLTGWPQGWRHYLVTQGYRVICLDNRDAGQSDILDHYGLPSPFDIAKASLLKKRIRSAYSLKDMAADAIGIMDHLAIDQAHIIGASMGGMISQRLAIHYPDRVKSLTPIMTMTGDRDIPYPSMKVQWVMLSQPRNGDRQAMMNHSEKLWRAIGSPAYPPSDEYLKAYINGLLDRGLHPKGAMRQLAAILAEEDRGPLLTKLDVPTLVIHGEADPLLNVTCGKQVAEKIPGAKIHIEPGMGHDFPEPIEEKLLKLITEHLKAADNRPE
ncbi:alpha/beta hydrolase [Endozoicomonas sp. Mp262]|uniref:alpha/beta fold hydrolase n=1 Tax=Endozoicomonas sp. Mp262 TaxID=2919499 RepID=UPI0021D801E2